MMDELVDTVLERLYAEDAAQRAANLPSSQRTRNVDRETGRWLALLVRATNARELLEIGSSNGVSTIWLAAAARHNGGTVTGTEILPERAGEANRNLATAGLDAVGRVIAGDARATVASLPDPSISSSSTPRRTIMSIIWRRSLSGCGPAGSSWPTT